ncbi:uncharacterized protein LOC117136904 [Drosophila mauritiana]|uniref:Uncharacterized protein LOC117136904 n=1 Tax=Drosophila mauritiana TaxID=7226 RepID=A0A6P8JE57_DROMA|nr:uncharacterized protein LOC117136904 [Drosophila mauritiana]
MSQGNVPLPNVGEQAATDEGAPPLPQSPENVAENVKEAEKVQKSPMSQGCRSSRILNRVRKCKEPEAQASRSVNVRKCKRTRINKSKKTFYEDRAVNCSKCGTSTIFFPARTKFFSCAEIDGRLFKVKRISASKVLGGAYRKLSMKRSKLDC